MAEEEESKRVSVQVSSLSTQLIESIDKQSHLEEQLLQARKVIASQQESIQKYENLRQQLEQAESSLKSERTENAKIQEQLQTARSDKLAAEGEVDRLNKEVEDLTASLFDEANNMVADARRETYSFQVRNSKLVEQLQEKETLLETLEIQLKNLKKVLYNLEEETNDRLKSNQASVAAEDSIASSSESALEKTMNALNGTGSSPNPALFSPLLKSLRYDLVLYSEFLKFIAALPQCASIRDSTSYSKLLRRLIHDEIQPALRLDNASGIGWYLRRNLMSLMIDGSIVVEPVSGINETYRVGHMSTQAEVVSQLRGSDQQSRPHLYNYPADSPPVAIESPCSFCSESRNDILEHGRLYVLKTLQKTENGATETSSQFPLCHYCLLKVRQTCEIFAFLRSLKSGAWHLEAVTLSKTNNTSSTQTSSVSISPTVEGPPENTKPDRKSKRMSFMTGLSKTLPLKTNYTVESATPCSEQTTTPTTNIQRAWAQLCKLRSSLHWAHIGVWSLEDVMETKIGPIVAVDQPINDSTISNSLVPEFDHEARESFSLHNEEDIDNEEGFDFEKMNNTLESADVEDKDTPQVAKIISENPPTLDPKNKEGVDIEAMGSSAGESPLMPETQTKLKQSLEENKSAPSSGDLDKQTNAGNFEAPVKVNGSTTNEVLTGAGAVETPIEDVGGSDAKNAIGRASGSANPGNDKSRSELPSQSATDDEESGFDDARSTFS
ncbi:LAQU0S15e01992g1_1 [Lachancea quebecensis]|uniref:LAQU0S15e01992g1_1 n=1 Tax=Lachancea quebecensis TaxID=1654605 RepID=A0A0P1KWE6_9SACH|nr:LAQU0S15e01992g1_1 [Lachancea quebecensis]